MGVEFLKYATKWGVAYNDGLLIMEGLHDNQWQTIVLLGHVLMHLDRDVYECALKIFKFF